MIKIYLWKNSLVINVSRLAVITFGDILKCINEKTTLDRKKTNLGFQEAASFLKDAAKKFPMKTHCSYGTNKGQQKYCDSGSSLI